MTTREELNAAFKGQFLQPKVWQENCWVAETRQGTHYIPVSVAPTEESVVLYTEQDHEGLLACTLLENSWLAQLKASGYEDQTDVTAFGTEQEAIDWLYEFYADMQNGIAEGQ